ncbi:MAG: hypothetical protein ABSA04_05525 [Desulfobaccales bacterium]|jgi:hypothetical protein
MGEIESYIDIYTHIGRFVVEFEQICHSIESGIRCILLREGLENEQIHEILLAGFTAEPLNELFRSLCNAHLKPDKETSKIINYVINTFKKLIPVRNDLLHGKWFMILKELEGKHKPVALGQKLHKNKTGSATKRFEYDVEKFKKLVMQATLSLDNMSKLSNCIAASFPITKNFNNIGRDKFEAIKALPIR